METSGLDCIGGAHRPHELAERQELAYGACPLHDEERGTSAKLQKQSGDWSAKRLSFSERW